MSKNLIENIYPLSPVQQGMLFHTLFAPRSGVYVQQRSCVLRGALDVPVFEAAWRRVVERHAVLRTAFNWEQRDEPFQVVYRQVRLPWERHDWRGLTAAEQAERAEALLARDRENGFELSRAPLMRLTLVRLGEDAYRFVWTHHHLLLDGWSLSLVLEEVLADYEALRRGLSPSPSRPRPYADYIAWLGRQDAKEAEAFWRRTLKGFRSPTPLAVERQQPAPAPPFGVRQARVCAEQMRELQALARRQQMTVNTLVQGAWALLLSRYSGEADVMFGATVAGRSAPLKGIESMVGLFINTLPVRAEADPRAPLVPWLKGLQARQFEAQQFEHSALVQIQGWSEVPRGLPLFESILVFENAPLDEALWEREGGRSLGVEDDRYDEQTNYALTLLVMPMREMYLRAIYDRRRFDAAAVERMLGHLKVLLSGMAARPESSLAELPLLTEAERAQLLTGWNDTRADFAAGRCVHELFEEQAARAPDAPAVIFGDEALSYGELNRRANRLAHHLRGSGVGPETPVGVWMERGLEMVVALLAVMKAGGAYVPLEPSYPEGRLASMLEELRVPALLTQEKFAASARGRCGTRVLCLDSEWESLPPGPAENPSSGVGESGLAYIIYTSGSTGRPKGAMNTHGALRNRLQWMQAAYGLTAEDRVLQKTPFSFDVSVWEFFWPLMAGACLVVARPEGHKESGYLRELIAARRVTTAHFVPSMLRLFLDEPGLEECESLRLVIASGEALPFELQERFFERTGAQLHNLYGPTEAAIDVTSWRCRPDGPRGLVPIGRPIANTQIYLLDAESRPVPVGVAGELHIGGVALARGYLRRPALTAEKFIPDPFSAEPGARLYKTGDLARFLPDGNIEFLGRTDNQVKIRGFRIELGEIEARLRQHEGVREAVVTAPDAGLPGEKRLVAYVEAGEAAPTREELREFLRASLPEYMVPQSFVMLERLPLTSNGKVDRRALPAPDTSGAESVAAYVAPRTSVEEAVVAIWSEVLGVERVGVNDNFFDLGGHSLLAIRVLSRVRNAFQIELPLRSILGSPTPAELAVVIIQRLAEGIDDEEMKLMLQELEETAEADQV